MSLCIGLKVSFINNNASEEKKAWGKEYVVKQINIQGRWSKRVILLGPDKCQ